LIFLAFIVPLAIYFAVLARVHRSRHPVMISGCLDFAGVLFAASGFILVGGPAILSGLHEQWRLAWLLGQTRYLNGVAENWCFWISLWGLYLVSVVAWSAFVFRWRRSQTSIYNIEPLVLEEVFSRVSQRLGIEATRSEGNHVLLHRRDLGEPADPLGLAPARAYAGERGDGAKHDSESPQHGLLTEESVSALVYSWAELKIEAFPAMRHVTLYWKGGDALLRSQFETALARALVLVKTRDNPLAGWFMSAAIALFLVAACGLLLIAVIWMRLLMR
jgi:hypothetical protein